MHSCYKVHLCSDAAFLYLAQSILYHTQASFLQVSFYMIWALLLKLETWPVFDFCPIWCLFFWAFTSSLHPQQAIKTQPPYCSGFLLTQASSSNLPHPIQMTSESVLSILLFFLRSLFYLLFFALPSGALLSISGTSLWFLSLSAIRKKITLSYSFYAFMLYIQSDLFLLHWFFYFGQFFQNRHPR